MMNTMLTAVDCACSVLMIGAAGIDQNETSSFESIAFVLQLVALIGESQQNMSGRDPTSSLFLQTPLRVTRMPDGVPICPRSRTSDMHECAWVTKRRTSSDGWWLVCVDREQTLVPNHLIRAEGRVATACRCAKHYLTREPALQGQLTLLPAPDALLNTARLLPLTPPCHAFVPRYLSSHHSCLHRYWCRPHHLGRRNAEPAVLGWARRRRENDGYPGTGREFSIDTPATNTNVIYFHIAFNGTAETHTCTHVQTNLVTAQPM